MHVFVDESERGVYAIGATFGLPRALVRLRRAMRDMVLPKERSIHFNNERSSRKRALLAAWCGLGDINTRIYEAAGKPIRARDACFRQLLADCSVAGTTRLIIESREGRDFYDRRTIYEQARKDAALETMAYEHMRPYEEPLLWLADGILWAHGAGGDWRRRVQPLIESVARLKT